MKRTTKWTTLLLSLLIMGNSMVMSGSGETVLPDDAEIAEDLEFEAVEESEVGEEIVEWREEGVRHYYLGDGMYQAVVSASVADDAVASPAATTPDSNAVEDTYISSSEANAIYGSSDKLWVSDTQTAYVYCEPPTLPDNAYIESAKLYFSYYYNISTGLLSLGAYQVNCPWRENTLTWNIANQYDNLGTSAECLGTASLYGTTTTTRGYVTITNAVKSWYETKELTSYGIALKRRSGTNNSVILLSSESGSTTAPSMVITYSLASLPIDNGVYYVHNHIEHDRGISNSWACLMQTSSNAADDTEEDPTGVQFCEVESISGISEQKWVFEYLHNGYYIIKNITETKVLAVQEGKENVADEVLVRETFTGNSRQQWKISLTNNGSYKIKPRSAEDYGIDWVMGTNGSYPNFGRNVRQVVYDGTDSYLNDEWKLRKIGEDVFMLAVNDMDGYNRFSCFIEVMNSADKMGYNSFNIQRNEAFTKAEIIAQMSASTVYVSISHGIHYIGGTSIIINDTSDSTDAKLTYIDIEGTDLSNCELMLFVACRSADSPNNSICEAAVSAGAIRTIGFEETIDKNDANLWTEVFFKNYQTGASVELCKIAADTYQVEGIGNPYVSIETIQSSKVFGN